MKRHMTKFRGSAVDSGPQLSVEDDSAADAGSQGDHNE